MSFIVAQRDYDVMAKAMKAVGLNENKAIKLVDALFEDQHMLIDSSTLLPTELVSDE